MNARLRLKQRLAVTGAMVAVGAIGGALASLVIWPRWSRVYEPRIYHHFYPHQTLSGLGFKEASASFMSGMLPGLVLIILVGVIMLAAGVEMSSRYHIRNQRAASPPLTTVSP